MSSILTIDKLAFRDDTIIRKEIYPYTPYTTAFGNSDEIRIAIQSQDSYLLPHESYLWIQLRASTIGIHTIDADHPENSHDEIYFVKNFASFLFSDVRYELNGVEIDRMRNVGRSSLMKLLIASRTSDLFAYNSYCNSMEATSPRSENAVNAANANTPRLRTYDVMIPLSIWFGFCDDYRKIVLNCKHELILNRAQQSRELIKGGNVAQNAAKVEFTILKILWKMPHITLSDPVKLQMLNYLSKNQKIIIQYRSTDMVVFPQLTQTNSHMWAVKTVSHVNRPRFIVVGFQTNRNAVATVDASLFDSCTISQLRLHLNSQIFPYNMNDIDIEGAQYSELYDMYTRIQQSYYHGTETTNFFALKYGHFQSCPLFAFDTSRADESLIDSSVDIKVEFKTRENIADNTAAFCLIVYDNEFSYSPFDGLVVRNI